MIDYNTNKEEKEKAEYVLEKFKKIENKTKMHYLRIDDKTVVYCKNEDRLEDYKKLK